MEYAMDSLSSDYEFQIRWEPYMLRPQTPPEGLPIPPGYKDPNNPRCFTDAEPLQEETCLNVAKECGLDVEQVKAFINDERNVNATFRRAVSWSEKGISGVPAFYFNGQKMFSGAQEPEVFKRMFEVVAEKFPVETPTSKS